MKLSPNLQECPEPAERPQPDAAHPADVGDAATHRAAEVGAEHAAGQAPHPAAA